MVRVINNSTVRVYTNQDASIRGLEWKGGVIGEGRLSNDQPISNGELSAFNNFTPHELAFMSLKGIPVLDVQDGCPNDCFGCGRDAQKFHPGNAMSPEKIDALLRGAMELREMGFDLFPEKYPVTSYPNKAAVFSLDLFSGSDLGNYRVRDAEGRVWTGYDVTDRFSQDLRMHMGATIAGWKPGGNFRSHAMEQWSHRWKHDASFRAPLTYSFKMVTRRARLDYDQFMTAAVKNRFGISVDELLSFPDGLDRYDALARERVDDFISGSRHVSMMIDNIRSLVEHGKLSVSKNYVTHVEGIKAPFNRYRYLFGMEMMDRVEAFCMEALGEAASLVRMKAQTLKGVSPRSVEQLQTTRLGYSSDRASLERGLLAFTEVDGESYGMHREGYPIENVRGVYVDKGVGAMEEAIAAQLGWKHPNDFYLDLYQFFSALNSRGAVSVYYGRDPGKMTSFSVTSSYFVERAKYHEGESTGTDDHATMARHYRMLAGLVGKNIFG